MSTHRYARCGDCGKLGRELAGLARQLDEYIAVCLGDIRASGRQRRDLSVPEKTTTDAHKEALVTERAMHSHAQR